MTKVQENLIVRWLESEIDDEDAQLLIKDFDAANLRHNLKIIESLTLTNESVEDKYNDFVKMKNN